MPPTVNKEHTAVAGSAASCECGRFQVLSATLSLYCSFAALLPAILQALCHHLRTHAHAQSPTTLLAMPCSAQFLQLLINSHPAPIWIHSFTEKRWGAAWRREGNTYISLLSLSLCCSALFINKYGILFCQSLLHLRLFIHTSHILSPC